jgi:hypothetical protein
MAIIPGEDAPGRKRYPSCTGTLVAISSHTGNERRCPISRARIIAGRQRRGTANTLRLSLDVEGKLELSEATTPHCANAGRGAPGT